MKSKIIFIVFCVLTIAVWRVGIAPRMKAQNTAQLPAPYEQSLVTPNTVRLAGKNVYAAATAITQTTYGATQHEDRPHAVTLVRADRQADAMLAASRITHFPVNSPVLYVDADRLPEETFAELKRLGPDGNLYDSNVQIYLVGAISERVEQEIKDKLGYKTRAFRIDDPVALSEELDTWAADVHTDHPDEVIIVQYEQLNTGLPAVAWNAHMGHGLFFVEGDSIPDATRRALSRRFNGEAFIYLFGDENLISPNIARELARYGHVQRIPGRDAFEIGVNFAGYHDAGFNQGYWVNWWSRDFGWDIGEAGHNFTFVNPEDWQQAVTGSLLSHMGKHGPMILLNGGPPDASVEEYLKKTQPSWTAANDQLNNHGWILGDTSKISWEAQANIDLLLSQKEENGTTLASPPLGDLNVTIDGIISKLRAGGAAVEPVGEKIEQPFFSVSGRALKVNGETVQIFEYRNAGSAENDAAQIAPNGTLSTTKVTWVAPPHFYRSGNLIALYVGANAEVVKALENALGRQFAGK